MVDRKHILSRSVQGRSYSYIAARRRCSRVTISKNKKIIKDHQFTAEHVAALGHGELASLFADRRAGVSQELLERNFEVMTNRRIRRCWRPLKVEWERYTSTDAPPGLIVIRSSGSIQ